MSAPSRWKLRRVWLVCAWLMCVGCNRHHDERDRANAGPMGASRGPGAAGTKPPSTKPPSEAQSSSAAAAPASLEPAPVLVTHLERHASGWRLSIQNHDERPVSLATRAVLERDTAGSYQAAGQVFVDDRCGAPTAAGKGAACQPLAPGAELLISPVRRGPTGKCEPLTQPEGEAGYRLTISTCQGEHMFVIAPLGLPKEPLDPGTARIRR